MSLALPILAVAAGLAALVKGADVFVRGAADGARLLRVPPLLVGMVVVGFGTSAPELTVSAISAWQGAPALALGNAYGSNICNVALILGCCAVIRPLKVKRTAWRFDLPVLAAVTVVSEVFLVTAGPVPGLTRPESAVLLFLFAIALVLSARRQAAEGSGDEDGAPQASAVASAARVAGGLIALVVSSRLLVWGAVELARAAGVGELVIGLTVVAIGTSLPELASSLAAVRRGEDDLAVGNIIGSNLFNTLAVVGFAGFLRPIPEIDPVVVRRDVPLALALTVALFAFGRPRRRADGAADGSFGRAAGVFFLLSYAAYMTTLALASVRPSA